MVRRMRTGRMTRIKAVRVSASSSSSSSSSSSAGDPHKILGVSPGDSDEIVRGALRRRRNDARMKGDLKLETEINDAYDKILMSSFQSRLSGKTTVQSNVKYADLFAHVAWRPKRESVSALNMQINAGVALVLFVLMVMKVMDGINAGAVAIMFGLFRVYKKLDAYYEIDLEYVYEGEGMAPATQKLLRACGVGLGFGAVSVVVGYIACVIAKMVLGYMQPATMGPLLRILIRPSFYINTSMIIASFCAATFFR